MKKYLIFFISTFIYSQTENFDNQNLISESENFTIQTPIGTTGYASNGSLRWYHNTESVVVDNFFFQMSGFTPYNGNGFAYLNAGMKVMIHLKILRWLSVMSIYHHLLFHTYHFTIFTQMV